MEIILKQEETQTEIEEEIQYSNGIINLGDIGNEPNTVIKYEQSSSQ